MGVTTTFSFARFDWNQDSPHAMTLCIYQVYAHIKSFVANHDFLISQLNPRILPIVAIFLKESLYSRQQCRSNDSLLFMAFNASP